MKHFLKYFPFFLILAVSCKTDDFTPTDIGLDYFPLQKGFYQVYNVEEVIYSEVAGTKNLAYQIRVEVTDSFPNTEGGYTYVLSRGKRVSESASWQALDTWSARNNDDRELIVSEGNTPFVKLTFPARKGSGWNGNKFNDLEQDEYEVLNADQPFTAGGMTFEKTLTVGEENNEDLIVFQDLRQEIYARGVGLVYREVLQLNYCTKDNCRGQQKITNGTIFKQTIIEYGAQ